MGSSSSKQSLDKALADCNEPILGLENFGNTCYANSVLQALYFCRPFRERLLLYASQLPDDAEENLLTCLAELFIQVRGLQDFMLCSSNTLQAIHDPCGRPHATYTPHAPPACVPHRSARPKSARAQSPLRNL